MKTTDRLPGARSGPAVAVLAACALPLAGVSAAQQQESSATTRQPMTGQQQESSAETRQPTAGQQQAPRAGSVEQVTRQWPEASKRAAQEMVRKYGEPDDVTQNLVAWHDRNPWGRIVVHKEPVQHNFPMPHEDVLEQVIAYDVPEDKYSELARYDGSVVAYRTSGELGVRCGQEAANVLALNLAHDIIEGNRTVEEARSFYADSILQLMQGEQPAYTQGLQFQTRTAAATGDPDERVLSEQQLAAASGRGAGQAPPDQQARQAGAQTAQGTSIAAMLSGELAGKNVVSADGEVIGEISEVAADPQGRHIAIIEVDGFLGLGQEEMALPLAELSMTEEGDLRTSLTKQQIEEHAEASKEKKRR